MALAEKTDKMPSGTSYIISNEIAERFSYYGMRAILTVFMTEYLMDNMGNKAPMGDEESKIWYHTFSMGVYFFPIIGAFIADVFWGKYKTILTLSMVYCLGHLALSLDDTRFGLAIGLTVMGFGVSALVIAPLMKAMIDNPDIGTLNTFLYLGIAFLVVITLLAQLLSFPPAEWAPAGVKTASATTATTPTINLSRQEMLRTHSFYALWATYTIGCLTGLMAIGIASPVGTEIAKLDTTTAALAVSLFAVFNGLGRPLFGAITDKLGPKHTAMISFAMILGVSLLISFLGQGNALLYLFAFCVLWMCLGGWLTIAPTTTGIFFGKKHYAQNYGLVFTAYGAGAILGTLLSGNIKDITGSYLGAFPIVAGLAILGMIIAAIGLNPVKNQQTG